MRIPTRIYIGNLPPNVRDRDVKDLFHKFGKIVFIHLKSRNLRGPPFAFVAFENSRDADDAVYARDGYNYDGYKLRVGILRRGGGTFRGNRNRSGYRGDRRRGPPARHSQYRVMVTGLPPTGSWQDLKDFMRSAGQVCFSDVYKDGTGVCYFTRSEDMQYALKKLDDTKFKSHVGETSYIRVKEDVGGSGGGSSHRGRSRSRSPRASRSKSRSPKRSRASPTYSPVRRSSHRSPSRDRSRSKSRSRRGSRSRSSS